MRFIHDVRSKKAFFCGRTIATYVRKPFRAIDAISLDTNAGIVALGIWQIRAAARSR
ncbi:hypothetical protein D9M69_509570 [compost metagenome]